LRSALNPLSHLPLLRNAMGAMESSDETYKDKGLSKVVKRASTRMGSVVTTGRYHRLPKKLSDDYNRDKKVLGSGYNGSVHLAYSVSHGVKHAVKFFKLHGVPHDKREELEVECEIFLRMDHPHIVRLADVYESATQLDLVMECMEGGELFDRVIEKKRFNEKDAAEASYQMFLAINYLHTEDVVHRDIKLENFLYEKKDTDHLKLIDFGFSKIWDHSTKMKMSCGTVSYVAPEVLSKSYTSQCDLWSLGVVIFILLVGYMPFSGDTESKIVTNIKQGRYSLRKPLWDKVSEEALDLVKKLLVVDPKKRLTANAALEHPWIMRRARARSSQDGSVVDEAIVQSITCFAHQSKFRRQCLSIMAWSLTRDERTQVRDAFLELDTNKNGVISLGEFKTVLEEHFDIQDEEATKAFRALDTTQSDEVHYSEFLAAMVCHRIAMHNSLLVDTFRRFDTAGTGYLTVTTLQKMLGDGTSEEDAISMMEKIDENGDGKISEDEFIRYIQNEDSQDDHKDCAHRVIDSQLAAGDKRAGAEHKRLKPKKGRATSIKKRCLSCCSGICG